MFVLSVIESKNVSQEGENQHQPLLLWLDSRLAMEIQTRPLVVVLGAVTVLVLDRVINHSRNQNLKRMKH